MIICISSRDWQQAYTDLNSSGTLDAVVAIYLMGSACADLNCHAAELTDSTDSTSVRPISIDNLTQRLATADKLICL